MMSSDSSDSSDRRTPGVETPAPPVVEFRNVSFGYNASPVVEDVAFTVGERDLACLVGPNGGGKTTLLRLILGLARPDSGVVRVFGESPEKARRRVGYMPQYVHHDPQFPVTVEEIVLMGRLGARWGGGYSKADRAATRDALEELDMYDERRRLFAELSGGQRQRVLIARALACEPDLLLLDEPTANIDVLVEARLLEFLQALNERMTILLVTHDLGFVSKVVKHVICVNRRVVMHPTSEITGEMIQDIYGDDVHMVRHDHRHSTGGGSHG